MSSAVVLGSLTDYVRHIQLLLGDRSKRRQLGRLLSENIKNHHCGKGWSRYLEQLQNNLPCTHRVQPLSAARPVPWHFAEYWDNISSVFNPNSFWLLVSQSIALSLKLTPDKIFSECIVAANSKKVCAEISNHLVTLGDHHYQKHEYPQALRCYEYFIKNNFALVPVLKYLLLRLGRPGIMARNDACKIKKYLRPVQS